MYGEKFYQLHAAQRQLLQPLNNLEKRILILQIAYIVDPEGMSSSSAFDLGLHFVPK